MRNPRGICAIFLLLPLVVSGCTGGSGSHATSSSPATSATQATAQISATSPATTTRTVSPSPVDPKGTVPVDQIPPGHPTHWLPAGMPTTAKYKEPGDVVPMFTPGLFEKNSTAPGAVVVFVIQALNWASATGTYTSALSLARMRRGHGLISAS